MGSGRRDFSSEFGEQVGKHLRRLPESARHGVSAAWNSYTNQQQGAQNQPADSSPEPPPVVTEIRNRWQQWNSPAAKLERRKRRTSAVLTLWIVLTALSVLLTLFIVSGSAGMFVGLGLSVIFGALTVRSSLKLRRLNRTELPAGADADGSGNGAYPLPAVGSAAREPMERLAESEASLEDLLTRLSTPATGSAISIPEMSVAEARTTAGDTAAALRELADRIQSIERAREATPDAENHALDSAIRALRTQLDEGVDGYGALVAAAGRAVAASSGGFQSAQGALTDATDRLAGLAVALRDLS